MSQPLGTTRERLVGAILGLTGSILILLGFIEPWLPAKIHIDPHCGPQYRGCVDYYGTTTITPQHALQHASSLYHDVPSPALLLIPLVLALLPLGISLYGMVRVPARAALALEAAAAPLGSLALIALCWYAAYASPGPFPWRQSSTSQLAHQLAPTLWLFLGYALIGAGWGVLWRAYASQPLVPQRLVGRAGGALGLAGSLLVLLGVVQPWLPIKVYVNPCPIRPVGCMPQWVTQTTTLDQAQSYSGLYYPGIPPVWLLAVPLVLALLPLAISLWGLVWQPSHRALRIAASVALLGLLVLVVDCLVAIFAFPENFFSFLNSTHQLAPTLWLFLGYALIWAGWWLLTRARRASEAKKG